MKLLIDNREPQTIIKYISSLNDTAKNKIEISIEQLDIGDYIFYDEINQKPILIIERKSLEDLESSIKDGRYNEQSFRLNNCSTHNHNIIYLIEGSIINYKKIFSRPTLYSTILSLNYYKGFSVINSINQIETGEILLAFSSKLLREKSRAGFYQYLSPPQNQINSTTEYSSVIKPSKKSCITENNIMEIMLMQIPGISCQTAQVISLEFKTFTNLLESLKTNPECLDNLKQVGGRKISKTSIEALKKFIT